MATRNTEEVEVSPAAAEKLSAPSTARLQPRDSENPAIQRALRRLRESQEQVTHMAHHTKHSSHSTHSKGGW